MLILFYTYGGDNRVAYKNDLLRFMTSQNGTLRYPASIINPTIRIDVSKMEESVYEDFIEKCNYFSIREFNRKYYITSKIIDSNNIVTITGHVDVLYTYYDNYAPLNALILRNENDYEPMINDSLATFLNEKEVTETRVVNETVGDIFFSTDIENDDPNIHYSLVVQGGTGIDWQLNVSGIGGSLPATIGNSFTIPVTEIGYALSRNQLKDISAYLKEHDSLVSYVKSLIAFPFTISYQNFPYVAPVGVQSGIVVTENGGNVWKEWAHNTGHDAEVEKAESMIVQFGTEKVAGNTRFWEGGGTAVTHEDYLCARLLQNIYSQTYLFYEFKAPKALSYKDYSPYTVYEYFLPYYGWVTIPLELMDDCTLQVYYTVNHGNGEAEVFIYNVTKNAIIFSSPCQLGIALAFDKDSSEYNTNLRQTQLNNFILKTIGGAIKGVAGLVGDNVNNIANGIGQVASSAVGYNNESKMVFESGENGVSSGVDGLYKYQYVMLRTTKLKETQITSSGKISAFHGLPCMKWGKIEDFTGMTVIDSSIVLDRLIAMDEEKEELRGLLSSGVIL